MIETFINNFVVTPERHILWHPVKESVSAILERRGKLMLIKERDGYGLPSGHLNTYEWLARKSGLDHELWEEIGVGFKSDPMLYGVMIHPTRKITSLGWVYKSDSFYYDELFTVHVITPAMREIESCGFFTRKQVRTLLSSGEIRKPMWNIPALEAWLARKERFVKFV